MQFLTCFKKSTYYEHQVQSIHFGSVFDATMRLLAAPGLQHSLKLFCAVFLGCSPSAINYVNADNLL
jgi:hypothetical protein